MQSEIDIDKPSRIELEITWNCWSFPWSMDDMGRFFASLYSYLKFLFLFYSFSPFFSTFLWACSRVPWLRRYTARIASCLHKARSGASCCNSWTSGKRLRFRWGGWLCLGGHWPFFAQKTHRIPMFWRFWRNCCDPKSLLISCHGWWVVFCIILLWRATLTLEKEIDSKGGKTAWRSRRTGNSTELLRLSKKPETPKRSSIAQMPSLPSARRWVASKEV